MTRLRCWALSAVALIGCAPAFGATDTMRSQVQDFVKAYVDAQNRVDASAQMEMVSKKPGASSISMGEIRRGWEAIRADVDAMVGTEGQFKISIGTIDVEQLGPNFALAYAPCTLTLRSAPAELQLRGALTLILDKSSGKWRVLHEHGSAQLPEVEGE